MTSPSPFPGERLLRWITWPVTLFRKPGQSDEPHPKVHHHREGAPDNATPPTEQR